MDDQTVLVLAIQLIALSCIAGSLLLYLLCKIKTKRHTYDTEFTTLNVGTGRSVLLTSCDSNFGLQLALHLTALGFRVFAGFKPTVDDMSNDVLNCDAGRILRAKLKHREVLMSSTTSNGEEEGIIRGLKFGSMITLPLDVTREDSLHEAVNIVRKHLPAGEDGLWAVVNTAGVCFKGRLELQDSSQWDAMFKINVVGTLRTARAFLPLLRNKRGRLLTIGTSDDKSAAGLVAYNAARHAVAGASCSLRTEIGPLGVHVITLQPNFVASEKLFSKPRIVCEELTETSLPNDRYVKHNLSVVPTYVMHIIEEALLSVIPKPTYQLVAPGGFSNYVTAITERFGYQGHYNNKDFEEGPKLGHSSSRGGYEIPPQSGGPEIFLKIN